MKTLILSLLALPLSFAATANPYFLNQKYYEEKIRSENYKDIAAQNIPIIKDMVLSQFKTDKDRKYFEKVMTGFKPYKVSISPSEKSHTVLIFGESFDVTLSDVNREQKSLKINDQAFQFVDGHSLEETTTQIIAILGKRQTQHNPLMNFMLGDEAHALIPPVAGRVLVLATVSVIPSALNDIRVVALTASLDQVANSCKTRNPKIPYEESIAHLQLEKVFRAKPAYTFEEQRQITDCKKWAESGSLKDYIDDKKTLQILCERGREAQQCMDEYKAASEKANPTSTVKNKSMGTTK
jgi:hypothetical protein